MVTYHVGIARVVGEREDTSSHQVATLDPLLHKEFAECLLEGMTFDHFAEVLSTELSSVQLHGPASVLCCPTSFIPAGVLNCRGCGVNITDHKDSGSTKCPCLSKVMACYLPILGWEELCLTSQEEHQVKYKHTGVGYSTLIVFDSSI